MPKQAAPMTDVARGVSDLACGPPRPVSRPADLPPPQFGILNQALVQEYDGAGNPTLGGFTTMGDVDHAAVAPGWPVQFFPFAYGTSLTWDGWDSTYSKPIYNATDWPTPDIAVFWPFTVGAAAFCSTFSAQFEYEERARARLQRNLSYLIGNELWGGTVAASGSHANHYLTDGHAVDVGLAATGVYGADKAVLGIAEAIGALEAVADRVYGGRIMIHMHPVLAASAAADHLVERQGKYLLTKTRDSFIVADSGYQMTGDAGTVDTTSHAWVYATAPVTIDVGPEMIFGANRGDPNFYQLFLRDQNTNAVLVERAVRFQFDPSVHLKALVDFTVSHAK